MGGLARQNFSHPQNVRLCSLLPKAPKESGGRPRPTQRPMHSCTRDHEGSQPALTFSTQTDASGSVFLSCSSTTCGSLSPLIPLGILLPSAPQWRSHALVGLSPYPAAGPDGLAPHLPSTSCSCCPFARDMICALHHTDASSTSTLNTF